MTESEGLERFYPLHSIPLTFPDSKTTNKKKVTSLYSDLNSGETRVVLGLSSDCMFSVDPNQLSSEALTISNQNVRKHNDLSCIRCSKTNPSLFYSSSNTEGSIFLWDLREEHRKPAQKFSTKNATVGGNSGSGSSAVKPILNFDISCGDQVLCGGTELVDEDSFFVILGHTFRTTSWCLLGVSFR